MTWQDKLKALLAGLIAIAVVAGAVRLILTIASDPEEPTTTIPAIVIEDAAWCEGFIAGIWFEQVTVAQQVGIEFTIGSQAEYEAGVEQCLGNPALRRIPWDSVVPAPTMPPSGGGGPPPQQSLEGS